MPSETVVWIISGITLLSSIFSPLLVAHINNKHQIKRDVIIPREKRKIEVCEKFLQCVGKRLYKKFNDYEEEYAELYSIIRLYVPQNIGEKITNLNALISDISKSSPDEAKEKKEYAKKLHSELCEALGNTSQQSEYYKV